MAASAKIMHEGKFLMLKRRFNPNKGKWAFPGGRSNHREETLVETCIRETYEETGLIVEVGEISNIAISEYVDELGNPIGRIGVNVTFKCEITRGRLDENCLATEAVEHGWFKSPPENCAYDITQPIYVSKVYGVSKN